MPVKSHYRLWYKTLGNARIITILLLALILPALFYLYYYQSPDKEIAVIALRRYIQATYPLIVLINPVTALKAYCEQPQKELLLQIDRRMRLKIALFIIIPTYLAALISLIAFYFLGMASYDLIIILLVSIMFQYSVAYTVAVIFSSVGAAIFFLISYAVINVSGQGELPLFPFYYTFTKVSLKENFSKIILYLLFTIALPAISAIWEQRHILRKNN